MYLNVTLSIHATHLIDSSMQDETNALEELEIEMARIQEQMKDLDAIDSLDDNQENDTDSVKELFDMIESTGKTLDIIDRRADDLNQKIDDLLNDFVSNNKINFN